MNLLPLHQEWKRKLLKPKGVVAVCSTTGGSVAKLALLGKAWRQEKCMAEISGVARIVTGRKAGIPLGYHCLAFSQYSLLSHKTSC